MELKIKICTTDSCKITITDLASDYQPENNDNSNYGKFRYSDTVSIDVLQLNKVEETTLQDPIFTVRTNKIVPITLPVRFDGWFKVQHIVLPSKGWFQRELAKGNLSILGMYQGVYYADGFKIYKYYDGVSTTVPLQEVVERNTENTTISRCVQDYVSICFLVKCYINLCKQIFNNQAFDKCWNKNKIDCQLTFKRDMVWMAINVIKYLVEFNQYAEAQRLIERLSSCNGLCGDSAPSPKKGGCGCGK